jgi:predicted DNA-binding transcriptional regulator AlpA
MGRVLWGWLIFGKLSRMEIMTVDEVATMLRLSKSHVYGLTHPRTRSGDKRDDPLPVLRIGAAVRFIRKDVEDWIEKMARR